MKRVLVYGDSNSWGFLDDGSGKRYADRWPVVMQRDLAGGGCVIDLIEECLPGRTTSADDPEKGAHMNGLTPLAAILLSHQPLDLIVIMLGTNDFKARFGRTAEAIAGELAMLNRQAAGMAAGQGGWHSERGAATLLVCPPPLGMRADDKDWPMQEEWTGGRAKSLDLAARMAEAAGDMDWINAGDSVQSSELDPIHWSADSHHAFGAVMARAVLERLEGPAGAKA